MRAVTSSAPARHRPSGSRSRPGSTRSHCQSIGRYAQGRLPFSGWDDSQLRIALRKATDGELVPFITGLRALRLHSGTKCGSRRGCCDATATPTDLRALRTSPCYPSDQTVYHSHRSRVVSAGEVVPPHPPTPSASNAKISCTTSCTPIPQTMTSLVSTVTLGRRHRIYCRATANTASLRVPPKYNQA